MNTYTFHVSGTHCASCKIFIEDALEGHSGIRSATVDLRTETLRVETDTETPEELAHSLTEKIASHGYAISVERSEREERGGVIWKALPIGLGVLALFFLLQKSGVLDIGIGGPATPVTGFLIGLIASVSSCLAVVGGLVLSLSAKLSEDDVSDGRTFALFHAGRLAGFALLGGVLGAVGGAFGIGATPAALLGLVASLVMLALGLNLVGVLKKNMFALPPSVFGAMRRAERGIFAPAALGAGTFFLPCGFTQSMQVAALSSGSFISGLLIMFAFALGTLPMLALLSFGSASFAHGRHAPLFFKTAGIVVVGLGVFSLLSALAGLGVISPLL